MPLRIRSLLHFAWPALALGDLGLLATRLYPWPVALPMPELGAAALDVLALLLVAFVFVFIAGFVRRQRWQVEASDLGLPAGLLAIGTVLLGERPPTAGLFFSRFCILLFASLFWGWAGVRAEALTGSPQKAIVAGLWSGMTSALLAVAVLLLRAESFSVEFLPGDAAFDVLLRTLYRARVFLLLSPLSGGMMGLFCASAAIHREEKKLREEEARRAQGTRR